MLPAFLVLPHWLLPIGRAIRLHVWRSPIRHLDLSEPNTASLGATPGTYTWSWNTPGVSGVSSASDDTFTLVISAAAVPEPSTVAQFGVGIAGLVLAGVSGGAGIGIGAVASSTFPPADRVCGPLMA